MKIFSTECFTIDSGDFLNGYLDNLNRLFSDDDAVSFQALLEKKNWLLRKLFVPIRFDREEIDGEVVYPEIHALSDSAFVFKNWITTGRFFPRSNTIGR